MSSHLKMNSNRIAEFINSSPEGPVVMLNMLKYKDEVSEMKMTGRGFYKEYMRQATPFFLKANAEIVFHGSPTHMLIGPNELALWDDVLIVKYNSAADFITMVMSEGYPSGIREQSLEDSRLIHCKPK